MTSAGKTKLQISCCHLPAIKIQLKLNLHKYIFSKFNGDESSEIFMFLWIKKSLKLLK